VDSSRDGPVVVGVDGSARSIDALSLADLLGPALGRDVLIAYVHPYAELSSLLYRGEYGTPLREVAVSTFEQVRKHLPSVPERKMRLVTDRSAAAGLQRLAEREAAGLIVVGSSHRSAIGRILVGGAGQRRIDELALLVVGSRGYGPLRAVLLGSVSSALVRSAASPLVVVPRQSVGESPL
jgi:nucleotide-binding universal stress UspA family protein